MNDFYQVQLALLITMITIQLIKTEQITGLRHKNLGFKEDLCRKENHVTYDNIDKCRVLCKMKLDTC